MKVLLVVKWGDDVVDANGYPLGIEEYVVESDCIITTGTNSSSNCALELRDFSEPKVPQELIDKCDVFEHSVGCGNGPYSIRYTRMSFKCVNYSMYIGDYDL